MAQSFLGTFTRFLSTSAPAAKVPLHLMPLGASITWGQGSTDGNGYRNDLRQMLINNGYKVTMVGSQKHGTMQNNENEGFPGRRVDQVEGYAKTDVPKFLPNLFTVHVGTNDVVQKYDLPDIHKRANDLLEYLWGAVPGTTIIFSNLIVNKNKTYEERILDVNKQYKTLADEKIKAGRKIVFVDMHGKDGPQVGDLNGDTHPNDVGYEKMAKIWFRGIEEAQKKGFLSAPRS